MATKQQLEGYLDNPNMRKFLDLLANSEGVAHGYRTMFGNGVISDLSKHPGVSKSFTQTDGKKNTTTAAGRYQFLKGTWNELAKKYGLTDFGERNQDIGALALIAEKGQLNNVVNGNMKEAVAKLGGTWASLPSSPHPQGKNSWETINNFIATGTWKGKPATTVSTPTAYQASALPVPSMPTDPTADLLGATPQFAMQPIQQVPIAPTQDLFSMAGVQNPLGMNMDLLGQLGGFNVSPSASGQMLPNFLTSYL